MIDVHCHLTEEVLARDLENVLRDAREAGIKAIVTSGTSYADCNNVLEVADNRYIYASLGLMPYYSESPQTVAELIRKNRGRVVAVGEVGLDHYLGGRDTWERQKTVFKMFIELSKELDLPLVIHSRSAGRYALDLLTSLGAERVIMHAFDGSASEAERGAAKGYYFSIPPSVVRSEQKQKMVRRLKLESLLLESDAPALGPERAAPNYPKNIKISAEYVARAKGLTLEKVVDVTMDNASQLLRIQTLF